ncbi:MAG: ABC transporter permease [Microbacteriaceae bacterium]|nr:ABC transporter permease [Microbacteriaceae bacterium]
MKKTEAIGTVTDGVRTSSGPGYFARYLAPRNISAVYLFVLIFIVFAIWTPQTFLTPGTWANLLDSNSLVVLAAIAVMIPLTTGVFNLAVGAEIALAMMLTITLQIPHDQQPDLFLALGLPWQLAAVVAIVVSTLIGALSGWVVTKLKIDSFIATLGMSSIIGSITYLISQNKPFAASPDFQKLAATAIPLGGFRLTLPVIVLVVIALVVWYVLERTPVGRRMYAAGFNPDGARLSGVNVGRLQWGSLVAGGFIAGIIGVLGASKFGGSVAYGVGMLLPALAAVFLGSTQFKGGRFNVWGTVLALYVLAVGVQGLLLVKVPKEYSNFLYGLALIVAVALSRWERTAKRTKAIKQATTLKRS